MEPQWRSGSTGWGATHRETFTPDEGRSEKQRKSLSGPWTQKIEFNTVVILQDANRGSSCPCKQTHIDMFHSQHVSLVLMVYSEFSSKLYFHILHLHQLHLFCVLKYHWQSFDAMTELMILTSIFISSSSPSPASDSTGGLPWSTMSLIDDITMGSNRQIFFTFLILNVHVEIN